MDVPSTLQSSVKDLTQCVQQFFVGLPVSLVTDCLLGADDGLKMPRIRDGSATTWYNQPEDSLQFFKEEKLEGAIYNVYLKKVRYHTSPDEVEALLPQLSGNPDQSTFYFNVEDDKKATLQWRLEEVRVIKSGTLPRLIDALSSDTGDLDSSYVDAFLATYRTFSTSNQVMRLLLDRYKTIADNMTMKQQSKEGHKRSIRTVILGWLDTYADDFCEPPAYPTLTLLMRFAQHQWADSALAQRLKHKIAEYTRREDRTLSRSIEDVTLEFGFNLQLSTYLGGASRSLAHSLDLLSIPSRVFAEQLTYVDAELFKKVIPYQCLGSVWSRRNNKKHGSVVASVFATVNQFNIVSYRVIATILKSCLELPLASRAQIIERWIDIAQELRILKNFSSLKAIISGLQSTAVFRLSRVWILANKAKLTLFAELAEIFSEDNNQQMCREVLYREGTAKFADPETVRTVRGRKGSGALGMIAARLNSVPRRASMFETANAQVIQGTVPYLGTFLTDLTMIDTAFSDTTDCGLINFDKCRKEYEILTQIKLLQSSAGLYKIEPDPAFLRYFMSLRVYDDNESYELSCEIQSESAAADAASQKHKRRSSLGYFSVHRGSGVPTFYNEEMPQTENNFYVLRNMEPDEHSLRSLPGTASPKSKQPKEPVSMRHSISVGALNVANDKQKKVVDSSKSSESIVAKIFFDAEDNNKTNQYKSIRLGNSDRTPTVVKAALEKYNLQGNPEDFCLFQQLSNNTELLVPEKMNVFYAVDTRHVQINFILRRKSDYERKQHRKKR